MPRPSFTATVKPPVHTRSVTEIMAESASLEERIIKTESQRLGGGGWWGEKQKQKTWKQTQRGKEGERDKDIARPSQNPMETASPGKHFFTFCSLGKLYAHGKANYFEVLLFLRKLQDRLKKLIPFFSPH